MDGMIVARSLGFFNPPVTSYGLLRIDEEDIAGTAFIDNIRIEEERPFDIAFIDDDSDRMDDDWERKHFGSATVSDGSATADQDVDLFIDLHEFLAGTIATNSDSYLGIQEISRIAALNIVVKWGSAEHRTYNLNRTPDPMTQPYAPIVSGIEATPPMNQETVSVNGAESHLHIQLTPLARRH